MRVEVVVYTEERAHPKDSSDVLTPTVRYQSDSMVMLNRRGYVPGGEVVLGLLLPVELPEFMDGIRSLSNNTLLLCLTRYCRRE